MVATGAQLAPVELEHQPHADELRHLHAVAQIRALRDLEAERIAEVVEFLTA